MYLDNFKIVNTVAMPSLGVGCIAFSYVVVFCNTTLSSMLEMITSIIYRSIYRQIDPISSLDAALLTIIEKHVPSRILHFRLKDKAWFDDNCRRALQDKQEAYFYWRGNHSDLTWNNYTRLRAHAQSVYASAE